MRSLLEDFEPEASEPRKKWFYVSAAIGASIVLIGGIYFAYATFYQPDIKVDGEIFIVTQGRGNVKLGLVQVCAIPEKQILDWIDDKQIKAKPQIEKAKRLLAVAESEKKVAEQEYQSADALTTRLSEATSANPLGNSIYKYFDASREAKRKFQIVTDKRIRAASAAAEYSRWTSPEYYHDGLGNCAYVSKTNSDGRFSMTLKAGKYALAAKSDRKVFDDTEVYYWLLWITPETVGKEPLMLSNDNQMTSDSPFNVVSPQL